MQDITDTVATDEHNRSVTPQGVCPYWLKLDQIGKGRIMSALIIIAFALFANTLANQFVYDDHFLIEQNEALRQWSYFTTAFTDSHAYDVAFLNFQDSQLDYYRPFTRMLFALAYQAFGLAPHYWHLLNLLIYCAVVALTYLVIEELTESRAAGVAGTLLFAAHPIHSEAVAWVNCLVETLHALFFLAAFLLYLRAQAQPDRARLFYAGSLTLALAALLSKETALALPILVGAHQFIVAETTLPRRIWKGVRMSVPYLLVVALYFFMRYNAYGRSLRIVSGLPLTTVLLTTPRVIVAYLQMMIAPVALSAVNYFTHVTSAGSLRFWLPLLLIVASALAIWRYAPRRATFAAAWILVTMLPILNFGAFTPELMMQDRYAFLPSLGLCAIVAMVMARVFTDGAMARFRAVAALLFLLSLAALCVLTVRQNSYWRTDETLWARAAAVNRASVFAHCNYASALFTAGKKDEAAQQFTRSIQLKKAEAGVEPSCGCFGLGTYYADRGEFAQAVNFFEQALALGEGNVNLRVYIYLAYSYVKTNQPHKAIRLLEEALRVNPDYQEARAMLAELYALKK